MSRREYANDDLDDDYEGGVFWPRNLLPEKIPNARILTYGYNLDVVSFLSQVNRSNIFHHASDMLSALEGERRESVRSICVYPERNMLTTV